MTEQAMLSNAPADDMARLVQAASDALTDSMVERLSITGANALEVLDRLNDEGTRDAIHAVLQRVTELHRTGALNTLIDLVTLLHAARDAATDNIVERLFAFSEQMVNTLGSEDLVLLADTSRAALQEAAAETAQATPRGGILATLSLLSRPESQRSLQFLLTFATKLQAHCKERSAD